MNFIRFKEAIEAIKKFKKDCLKQIEDKEDFLNQIKGDTVLSWCNRIIIVVLFFAPAFVIAFLLFLILPKEYAILIVAVFTLISGIGIFIIRTADRKKEFNDKKQDFKDALFSQRNSRLVDAIKLISQEEEKYKEDENSDESDGLNQGLIRFSFSELIEFRKLSDFEKRIDLFTSHNRFRRFDLSGFDLSGFDFNNTKLIKTNLDFAFLEGANLKGANLKGADLVYAKLAGANLVVANLKDAKLAGANLSGAKLTGANLSGAILQDANLSGADLRDANLVGIILQDANLESANLSGAILQDANLSSAVLKGANLSDINLSDANLEDANLSGAILQGADLEGADLEGAILQDANLSGADFSNAKLDGTDLRGTNWRSATSWDGANWEEAILDAIIKK